MDETARPQWLSVVTHLDPRFGGLSTVVPQLAAAVSDTAGRRMRLAAFCSPDEVYHCPEQLSLSTWPTSRMRWLHDRSLGSEFNDLLSSVAGVHVHGLWEQSTAAACSAARTRGLPYLVSAHGMLEPWALQKKAAKKRLYAALVERTNLDRAGCLHALTAAEAADYRAFGCKAPIAVIPNGVSIPKRLNPELFLSSFPDLAGKRLVLFLGRLHAKKGLDLLVDVWPRLSTTFPDAHLVLAGPDFDATHARLSRRIAQMGLERSVTFTGMLRDEQKWSALAASECFVLPSFSEGLSVSVLEAMGAGLPVVVSEACNLPEVTQAGAGWVIKAEGRALDEALHILLSRTAQENNDTGDRGRSLVDQQYSWPIIAERMDAVYRWLEGGSRPACLNAVPEAGERQ